MRKSGLHKQIAFIFEGTPAPENPAAQSRSMMQRLANDEPSTRSTAPAAKGAAPSDQTVSRPKPAPKAPTAAPAASPKKSGRPTGKKKTGGSETNSAGSRQKTMTILVGILSVVFLAVMVISFGGIGQTTSKAAASTPPAADVVEPVKRVDPESWAFPEPLPAQMRNPMVIPKPQALVLNDETIEKTKELAVRGIVYSTEKPSAIIGDLVMVEGQTISGVKVISITRETVEFEKDGKRWTQGVQ